MSRTTSRVALLIAAALALPSLNACFVTVKDQEAEPPPPPPPAPAQPAPAPTPAPAPAPAPEAKKETKKKKKKKKRKDKKSTATVKGDSVNIPGNIVFNSGEATFKEENKKETIEVLEQLKKFLEDNPQVTLLRIEGHTDDVGGDADNEKLSGERALTIKNWLVENGVKKDRLIAVGFGEKKPIADNSTEEGKAQNRRTEFRIAEIKGKKYLNRPVDGGGKVFE